MKRLVLLLTVFLAVYLLHGQSTEFFSRQSGSWGDVNTWSTVSHAGAAASRVPKKGDYINIGDNDAVTLDRDLDQPGISLEVYGGGSLTGNYEIYIQTGGAFLIGQNGSGTINVDHLLIKNNATVYIYSDGSVTTQTYVDNNQTITVDGELIIGTYFNNDGTVN